MTCSPALAEGSPEIPEQARKLIDVSEETAVSVLPGCPFCGYSTNYDGSLVDTRYARVTENKHSSIYRKALAWR